MASRNWAGKADGLAAAVVDPDQRRVKVCRYDSASGTHDAVRHFEAAIAERGYTGANLNGVRIGEWKTEIAGIAARIGPASTVADPSQALAWVR